MAEARGRGDNRVARSTQGQQSGSKRPRHGTTGEASPAPKKGDMPVKGTRAASPPKGTPSKKGK